MKNKTAIDKQIILAFIPFGKNHSIKKETLCSIFNLRNDRMIRAAIEELRQEGYCIIADTMSGGYYIPANEVEARDYLNMELKRLKTVISNTKNLFRIFNQKYPKLNLNLELML